MISVCVTGVKRRSSHPTVAGVNRGSSARTVAARTPATLSSKNWWRQTHQCQMTKDFCLGQAVYQTTARADVAATAEHRWAWTRTRTPSDAGGWHTGGAWSGRKQLASERRPGRRAALSDSRSTRFAVRHSSSNHNKKARTRQETRWTGICWIGVKPGHILLWFHLLHQTDLTAPCFDDTIVHPITEWLHNVNKVARTASFLQDLP